MEEYDTKELARNLMKFNLKFGHWSFNNYDKEFNKNGKGNLDLTLRQYSILMILRDMPVSTISQLQELLHISKSSLSLTISKLVDGGYLVKQYPDNQDDGRKVYIFITQKGNEALEEADTRVVDLFVKFYESLDKEKKENLKDAIEKLTAIF